MSNLEKNELENDDENLLDEIVDDKCDDKVITYYQNLTSLHTNSTH